jgi:hypothetical protein
VIDTMNDEGEKVSFVRIADDPVALSQRPGQPAGQNDEQDARDLADLLRLGRLAKAWIVPPEVRSTSQNKRAERGPGRVVTP